MSITNLTITSLFKDTDLNRWDLVFRFNYDDHKADYEAYFYTNKESNHFYIFDGFCFLDEETYASDNEAQDELEWLNMNHEIFFTEIEAEKKFSLTELYRVLTA